ncbi:MAG TPA: class I SAM-dependent methyltransferase [Gemmatimonadaceae bacterium]|jgi:ubiquinone/menaquinone biosynthesis C-methylase UbiE
MNRRAHWDLVYTTKQPNEVSWYQPSPLRSLELLREAGAGPHTTLIDIGGGDSTLVDAVVADQLGAITVLDISGAALARARARLGDRAREVTWLEDDATRVALPAAAFDIWHDRAVFHFLTDAEDRARYVTTAAAALKPGGALIIATFAEDGPQRCSGLDVTRYSAAQLAQTLGEPFQLRRSFHDVHHTPSGGEQRFSYCVFRRQ